MPKNTAHQMKFSIKDFFSKRDQIRSKMKRLLKKSLMENFIFCAMKNIQFSHSFQFYFDIIEFDSIAEDFEISGLRHMLNVFFFFFLFFFFEWLPEFING